MGFCYWWVRLDAGLSVDVGFLLRLSFRIRPQSLPGIFFSLAWLTVYFEGQLAFFSVLGLLSQIKPAESLLAGVILAGMPVLMAGMLGFRRQPWGKPFTWPLHLGTKKTTCFCLVGLVLVWLFDWGYTRLSAQVSARTCRQARRRCTFKDEILNALSLAVFALTSLVTVFIDDVNIRFQPADFRVGIHPARSGGNERLLHKFDRADDVAALLFGQ